MEVERYRYSEQESGSVVPFTEQHAWESLPGPPVEIVVLAHLHTTCTTVSVQRAQQL